MGATPGKPPRILPEWLWASVGLPRRCPHCDEEWERVLRRDEPRDAHEAQCRQDAKADEAQPQQPEVDAPQQPEVDAPQQPQRSWGPCPNERPPQPQLCPLCGGAPPRSFPCPHPRCPTSGADD